MKARTPATTAEMSMPAMAQAKFMGSELTKAGNVVTEPKVKAVVTTFMMPRNAPPTAPPMICASQTFLFFTSMPNSVGSMMADRAIDTTPVMAKLLSFWSRALRNTPKAQPITAKLQAKVKGQM